MDMNILLYAKRYLVREIKELEDLSKDIDEKWIVDRIEDMKSELSRVEALLIKR